MPRRLGQHFLRAASVERLLRVDRSAGGRRRSSRSAPARARSPCRWPPARARWSRSSSTPSLAAPPARARAGQRAHRDRRRAARGPRARWRRRARASSATCPTTSRARCCAASSTCATACATCTSCSRTRSRSASPSPPGLAATYGILSVLYALWADVDIPLRFPPAPSSRRPRSIPRCCAPASSPRPRAEVGDLEAFERLVQTAFTRRRRTLENNLQDSYPNLKEHLRLLNIEGRRRAETLSVVEFAQLARALVEPRATAGLDGRHPGMRGMLPPLIRRPPGRPGRPRRVRPERARPRVGGGLPPRRRGGGLRHAPSCRASTPSSPTSEYLAERARGSCAASCSPTATRTTSARSPSRCRPRPARPVYGSRLTLGFVRRRLRERGVEADLRLLTPGQPVELGAFRVHPIRVAHSVIDSLALAIETPGGRGGDERRLQDRPRRRRPTSRPTWRRSAPGATAACWRSSPTARTSRCADGRAARTTLIPAFEEVFARTRGRVLVSCFATSIPRIQRVAEAALARRPLASASWAAAWPTTPTWPWSCGLLDASRLAACCPRRRVHDYPAGSLCLFVSGSQGEPFSALSMVSIDEHRDVAVGPGDTVVLSVAPDPRQRARGLARDQQPLPARLRRRARRHGARARLRARQPGRAGRDDPARAPALLRARPRRVPHAGPARAPGRAGRRARGPRARGRGRRRARRLGRPRRRKAASVPAGRILLDRSGVDEIEEVVVRDRRHLSSDGIVVPVVVLDRQTGRLESAPGDRDARVRGLGGAAGPHGRGHAPAGRRSLETRPPEERYDPDRHPRARCGRSCGGFFRKRTQRRPMVIPVVMEV